MKHILLIGCLVAVPALAHADTQTKSWFVAHPDIRKETNARCQDNPGGARHDDNCINAAAAEEVAYINRVTAHHLPTVFDQCDQMPPLFQRINHCGAFSSK